MTCPHLFQAAWQDEICFSGTSPCCVCSHLQVLRHFHDDSVKLQAAVDHLIDIGFLSRRDVLRAGGVNMLWGLLLQVRKGFIFSFCWHKCAFSLCGACMQDAKRPTLEVHH
jgi:hypothetical protein